MLPFWVIVLAFIKVIDRKIEDNKKRKCKVLMLILTIGITLFGLIPIPLYQLKAWGSDTTQPVLLFFSSILISSVYSTAITDHIPPCSLSYDHWGIYPLVLLFHLLHILFLTDSTITYALSLLHIFFYLPIHIDLLIVLRNGLKLKPDQVEEAEEQEMEVQVLDVSDLDGTPSDGRQRHSCEMCFIAKASSRSCGHLVCHQCADSFMMANAQIGVSCPIYWSETANYVACRFFSSKRVLMRDCGHYICQPCQEEYPDRRRETTYACPFCILLGIVNGKCGRKEKARARKKLEEIRARWQQEPEEPEEPEAPGTSSN
uniref:RING-type domain-containing protein n=1 Tax=Caenorhabditis tropicalis TaxID=1561998 RepID=A0A1I7UYQ4_9PELO